MWAFLYYFEGLSPKGKVCLLLIVGFLMYAVTR
jgi:hypothetical protein